jgi:hypothetical protein
MQEFEVREIPVSLSSKQYPAVRTLSGIQQMNAKRFVCSVPFSSEMSDSYHIVATRQLSTIRNKNHTSTLVHEDEILAMRIIKTYDWNYKRVEPFVETLRPFKHPAVKQRLCFVHFDGNRYKTVDNVPTVL